MKTPHLGRTSGSGATQRRAFLLQSGLRDGSTHFLQETIGWVHNLEAHAVTPLVMGHRSWSSRTAPELSVAPVFRAGPETPVGSDPTFTKLQTFVEASAIFGADCAALDAGNPGPDDLVIVPYATDIEIMGVARWAERRRQGGGDLPVVVVVLHRPEEGVWNWDPAEGRLVGDLSYLAYALHRLVGAFGPERHAAITTNTDLAEALRGRVPGRIVPGCAPQGYPWLDRLAASGPILYDAAFLGQMRPEKGSRILAAILRRRLEAAPGARFAVQLDCPGDPAAWLTGYEAIRDDARIRWLPGSLDEATYASVLARTACVLLPASPDRYRLRISGVFCDALAAGRPVIVPGNSWMATMLERGHGAGIAVRSPSPASYARALGRLDEARAEAERRAAASALPWRAEQSMSRFVGIVLGAVPPA